MTKISYFDYDVKQYALNDDGEEYFTESEAAEKVKELESQYPMTEFSLED